MFREDESFPENTAQSLSETAAKVFQSAPGRTWVKLQLLSAEQYAEDAGGPPEGVAPVFVSVLKATLEEPETLSIEAQSLAQAIGQVLKRPPENVHIFYEPPGRGRVAFGGNLLLG